MYRKPELGKKGNLRDLTFNDPLFSLSVATGAHLPLAAEARASGSDNTGAFVAGVLGFAGVVGTGIYTTVSGLVRKLKR